MLAVNDLILSIPATSVEAERGFSVMKRVKTDFRSRLTSRALNDLLRIILLSPPEAEFEPEPAITHWYNATDRRDVSKQPAHSDEEEMDDVPLADLLHDALGRA